MNLLIVGSRHLYPSTELISELVEKFYGIKKVIEVVSGGADGVDSMAEVWAKEVGLPRAIFYPGYGLHGRKFAPYVRNNKMGFYADAGLAIWDGKSPGTKHMINAMRELGKNMEVHILGIQNDVRSEHIST